MAKKKIGLALSGGGARGFAHAGVLRALIDSGLKVDLVAGTSAGAIVGGAFAAGMSPDEIVAMSERITWGNMTRPSMSPLGFLSNAPMGKFVERNFPARRIEDCRTPFAAVACDFASGEEVVLTTGDLAFAIRASCAVPGVFTPLTDKDGRFMVDGGVVSPIPIATVRAMGADVVIAVDLMACGATFRSHPRTALGMGLQSTIMLLRGVSRTQHNDADVIIEPQVAHLRPDQISKRDEFITLGEAAARENITAIKQLLQ